MFVKKFFQKYLIIGFICLVGTVLLICLPSTAYGATGTLGSVVPDINCVYYDSQGNEVDGNDLAAGTYDMSIQVSGVTEISVLEVTASYTDAVTVDATPKALMTDSVDSVSSMGYVIDGQNLVFGFVSNNDDTSAIEQDTVIATLSVTFNQDCDAADVITISQDPNLTFVLADYGDGYNDEYALVSEFEGYDGILYQMTSDVSPLFGDGYTVTGSVVIMTDPSGSTAGTAVSGEYTLTVYSDAERTNVVQTVKTTEVVNEDNKKENRFVIEHLYPSTYYATLSSAYAIARDDITIVVADSDIAGPAIPIIACDFDQSNTISASDAIFVYRQAALSNSELYYDLDGSNTVSASDAIIVYTCAAGAKNYPAITISN